MLLSEMIAGLQNLLAENGDAPIFVPSTDGAAINVTEIRPYEDSYKGEKVFVLNFDGPDADLDGDEDDEDDED